MTEENGKQRPEQEEPKEKTPLNASPNATGAGYAGFHGGYQGFSSGFRQYTAPVRKVTTRDELVAWGEQATPNEDAVPTPFAVDAELNARVCVFQGNITRLQVDAVVNAANSGLRGGGGVDGAIHDAAGYELYSYLVEHYRRCDEGDFKPSPGFRMPCKEILHAVGPIGERPAQLRSVYLRCLDYVREKGHESIAFPCISTGIFGYRNERACPVVLQCVREWLAAHRDWRGLVVFVMFKTEEQQVYLRNMPYFFPKVKIMGLPLQEMGWSLDRLRKAVGEMEKMAKSTDQRSAALFQQASEEMERLGRMFETCKLVEAEYKQAMKEHEGAGAAQKESGEEHPAGETEVGTGSHHQAGQRRPVEEPSAEQRCSEVKAFDEDGWV